MTFDHPNLLLLLLLLPVLWLVMRLAPGTSRLCLALKCAAFTVLVIALASPGLSLPGKKVAVTVLVDTSTSMPRESLQRGQIMLRDLVRKKSGADLRLITFAGTPHFQPVSTQADKVTIAETLDPKDGMSTDLEGALQLALNTFPFDGARRVLLISDGNENQGHALSAALRARSLGVPVFTVPSGGTAPVPVSVESIATPQNVFSGEHFTASLQLESAGPLPVRVWITSRDREIGSRTLNLQAGENTVDLDARIVESGVILVEVHISSTGAQQVLISQAITVRRPRVLYVAGGGRSSTPLLETLRRAQVDVESAGSFPVGPAQHDWDAVLLDNYPDHELSDNEQSALDKYVFMGGGLIFIAGDANAKLAREPKTPFEKMLPVRALVPPEKPAAVVLVLDKSGSMEGPKIQMVRQAARASLLTLRPVDRVGVMVFDEIFKWVIPIGPATDLDSKAELINHIDADGDTNIYAPALAAFEAIVHENVSRRHIILLTDGDQTVFTFQDFPKLEADAAAAHVTISTIGVGAGVKRELLEALAEKTGGKSHFVFDPQSIPQIVNDEVRSVEDLAIQERPVGVVLSRPVEFTDGIDFTHAPNLLGFVQAEAKENTETILRVDSDKPLLVRWHYGLGSVMAFMSDANSRWAGPWVSWKSFGTLWPQMVRDVSHRDQTIRAGVRSGAREGEAIVDYDILKEAEGGAEPAARRPNSLRIVVKMPDGTSQTVSPEETAPGHYEARVRADQRGLYRITSDNSEFKLPEVGFYRDTEELKAEAVNVALLREISRVTGGEEHPSIERLLSDKGSLVSEHAPLWPYLLVLALALNFLEVALRRGLFKRPARKLDLSMQQGR